MHFIVCIYIFFYSQINIFPKSSAKPNIRQSTKGRLEKENMQRAEKYQPFGKEVTETNPNKI